jgi:hypothetical protein
MAVTAGEVAAFAAEEAIVEAAAASATIESVSLRTSLRITIKDRITIKETMAVTRTPILPILAVTSSSNPFEDSEPRFPSFPIQNVSCDKIYDK